MIEKIRYFNRNKSLELYRNILNEIEPEHALCIDCNDVIYFSESFFRMSKQNVVKIEKKSHRLFKIIFENKYFLSVCEKCLKNKFPNYKNRLFNSMNNTTKYAFNIPDDIFYKWKKENVGVTLNRFINLYGDEKGKLKWDIYCKKQADTNKYEYKKNKYNWSEEDFKNYNNSRAVTLKNLIKKHGDEIGLKIWKQYIEKQTLTKSAEYYINKYGEEKWKELNKNKAQTLENFIKRYGNDNALIEYKKYLKKRICYPASKSSQIFFSTLDKYLCDKYKTYFYEKNGKEFSKLLSNGRFVFLDYYIKELKLNIEYNGDVFHANPIMYKKDDMPNPFTNETAEEIWYKDNEKLKLLELDHNIRTIVIWESDLPDINDLIKKINEYV